MEKQTYSIKNVNLRSFELILNQAILVRKTLMLDFDKDFVRSCSTTATETFLKVITIPTHLLCEDQKPTNINIEKPFDFFLISGELLKPNFAFFDKKSVTLEFSVKPSMTNQNRMVATHLTVIGLTSSGSQISTTIPLTDETINNESIEEYETQIKRVSPDKDAHIFNITTEMVEEVKKLISTLNKTNVNNSIYITMKVGKDYIEFYDKVFNVRYDNDINNETIEEPILVNIVKSDWVRLSVSKMHDIISYVGRNENDKRIIFITPYLNSIVNSLMMKVDGVADGIMDESSQNEIEEITSLDLDLSQYTML